jgi:hypothetical protein
MKGWVSSMANFNRQTDNRDAKRRRRRAEVRRKAAKMQAENQAAQSRGEPAVDLKRKIRELRKEMRVS